MTRTPRVWSSHPGQDHQARSSGTVVRRSTPSSWVNHVTGQICHISSGLFQL